MVKGARSLRRKAYYTIKMKQASHLLFYRRHKIPGVKGWELRRVLGSDYPKVISLLDDYLEKLDLKVKVISEEGVPEGEIPPERLDRARFYITLRGELTPKEAKLLGWRIDDLAALAVAVSYIISKGGKAPRKEVEELLRVKIPGWKVDVNLDRFIRYGYIGEDENAQLYIDWRTRAEVDQKELIDLLLGAETEPMKPPPER